MNRYPFAGLVWSGMALSGADQFVFGGDAYRLIAVLGTLALAARRRWLAAGMVYLFILATLIRAQDFFRAGIFVVPCLAFGGWLLHEQVAGNRAAVWLVRLAQAAAFVTLMWLIMRGGAYVATEPQRLTFEANWGAHVERAGVLRRMACGRDDVRLLYYPLDSLLYFFADMHPSSRYQVVYQWTADTLPGTIQQLSSGKHLVYADWNRSIWGYKVSTYASPLYDFLQAHYIVKPDNLYLSPELAQVCP